MRPASARAAWPPSTARTTRASAEDWAEHNEGMRWWLEDQQRQHDVALAQLADQEVSRIRIDLLPEAEKLRVAVDAAGNPADEDAPADNLAVKSRSR